jgi:hypothetical protein
MRWRRVMAEIDLETLSMRYLLASFEYDDKDADIVGEPDPLIVGRALAD